MSDTRWQTLERLFEEGLELAPEVREAWLARQHLDGELHAELRAMFAAEAGSEGLSSNFDTVLAQALEVPLPGMRLGPYRLLQELGSGGMGLVFLAERADDQFRQRVAIKLIRGQAGAVAARQLRHERQVLAELVHPNIARLLDGGATPTGQPYLVMEYVAGEPVTTACRKLGLSRAQRVALVRDVAQAVHYAHQRLVVHRDIKPANVLLREDGRPLLLDFGIAKLLDGDARIAEATQPWFTPAYASPEQRAGLPLSTATDVYALGLLLFELVADRPPAPDIEGALAPERALLGRELDRIVQRATAIDPARRYSSAEALADDLHRYLAGEPVQAMPDRLGYRVVKRVRRHPFASAAAVAAAALLALFAWRLADERDRALQAEAKARVAEAQAQRETQAAEGVTAYLVDLFRAADPEQARGASMTPSALIDRGSERLAHAEVSAPQRVRLLGAFGEIYINLGHPEKASKVLESALADPAPLSPRMRADLTMNLARAAEGRQRFAEAERHFRDAVALWRQIGDEHELAQALHGLGLALSRGNEDQEAESVLREALTLLTHLDGPGSTETLLLQVTLAEALFNSEGRQQPALELMKSSIAGLRRQLPPDNFDLIAALGFYATMLRDAGDNDTAEKVLLDILAQRQAVLEHDSQQLVLVHNNLGRVYYNRGETLKAVEQFRTAYELGNREGAEEDPARAIDLLNLASLYEEVSDYDQAIPLMREGARVVASNPDAGMLLPLSAQNFGRLLMLAGRAAEARTWLEKPIPDVDSPDYAMERGRQRVHLADWHRRYGSLDEAERWLREAELHVEDIGGPDSPRVAAIERVRGQILAARGDRAGARRLFESASARLEKARNAQYVGVGDLALELADLALADGDRERARRELERARKILDPQLAPNAPQRARWAAMQRRL
jgi:tetratricopeptide (TPR) repeat protein